MMYKFFIPIVLSLLIGSALPAQSSPESEQPISVEFVIYSWKCTLPELNYTGNQKVSAHEDPFTLSPVHTYMGPPELSFYSAKVNPDASDGKRPTPIASVNFEGASGKYIILTASASKGRYQMYAIPVEDSGTNAPYIRVRNFTQFDLAIKYDAQRIVTLAPREIGKIEPAGAATVLQVARFEQGRWLRAFNNVAELYENGPMDIIFASEGNRPVSMFRIPKWPGRIESNQEAMVQGQ